MVSKEYEEKMKKILITGGAGFVGSHLCRKLILEGHEVICVDNLFTGKKENIYDLLDYNNFEFVRWDICNPYFCEVEEIYNLASPASPIHYQFNPIKTIKTSTVGVINVLGLAKRLNAKILQASTSEVYGDPFKHPQKEDYWGNVNPIGIRSCYDEGKRCAETLFSDYSRAHNLKVRIARIFNTYGPNMDIEDGRVVSNFIVQSLKGQDLTIYGDGSQTRSFQYVDNLVEGLFALMNNPSDYRLPVNIGNSNEFSILELAELVLKKTNSRSKIKFVELPGDDPKIRRPDTTLAKSIIPDWKSDIDLDKGLSKTIDYFKSVI